MGGIQQCLGRVAVDHSQRFLGSGRAVLHLDIDATVHTKANSASNSDKIQTIHFGIIQEGIRYPIGPKCSRKLLDTWGRKTVPQSI